MNIQAQMKELFGNSCLAYCYATLFTKTGHMKDVKDLTKDVLNGWYRGFIDDDGYVSKPIQYIKMLDSDSKVVDIANVAIDNLEDLPNGFQVVEYKKNPKDKASHFVIADHNGVLFDPSGDSQTVKVGKPVSYRRFIYD